MTIDQYEKATALLEEINSVKGYINQFQSTIGSVQFENKEEEIEYQKDKSILNEAILNLKNDLKILENEFEKL